MKKLIPVLILLLLLSGREAFAQLRRSRNTLTPVVNVTFRSPVWGMGLYYNYKWYGFYINGRTNFDYGKGDRKNVASNTWTYHDTSEGVRVTNVGASFSPRLLGRRPILYLGVGWYRRVLYTVYLQPNSINIVACTNMTMVIGNYYVNCCATTLTINNSSTISEVAVAKQ